MPSNRPDHTPSNRRIGRISRWTSNVSARCTIRVGLRLLDNATNSRSQPPLLLAGSNARTWSAPPPQHEVASRRMYSPTDSPTPPTGRIRAPCPTDCGDTASGCQPGVSGGTKPANLHALLALLLGLEHLVGNRLSPDYLSRRSYHSTRQPFGTSAIARSICRRSSASEVVEKRLRFFETVPSAC